jgi:taurine dioxygenase
LQITPLSPALGVEVRGVDVSQRIDAHDFARLRAAWECNCVILFRGQALTEEQQIHFASRFGPLATLVHPQVARSHPAVMLISNVRENGALIGALPDGEMQFHSDQCYVEMPATGTMLFAMEIPSSGGNTLFGNLFRAYEELPQELKTLLDGKLAMHSYDYATNQYRRPGQFRAGDKHSAHPIFRTHAPTGRKTLYVNRLMTDHIVGMPRAQSDEVLARLFDHQEQRKFVYEHVWSPGDLLMWDNRSCIHARTDFSDQERRMLRRITLMGEQPY